MHKDGGNVFVTLEEEQRYLNREETLVLMGDLNEYIQMSKLFTMWKKVSNGISNAHKCQAR
jgi:hypothetical protein